MCMAPLKHDCIVNQFPQNTPLLSIVLHAHMYSIRTMELKGQLWTFILQNLSFYAKKIDTCRQTDGQTDI